MWTISDFLKKRMLIWCRPVTEEEVSLQTESACWHVFKYSTESTHLCCRRSFGGFSFFFYMRAHFLFANCAESIMGLSSAGSTEGCYSCSGQQTGCERFHDSSRDLPVSHTQHHYNTPVARPSLLRADRRRVSWVHASHALSPLSDTVRQRHWRSPPQPTILLSPPPVYRPVWTGWRPRSLQTRVQQRLKRPHTGLFGCWHCFPGPTPHQQFWWSPSLDTQKYY